MKTNISFNIIIFPILYYRMIFIELNILLLFYLFIIMEGELDSYSYSDPY